MVYATPWQASLSLPRSDLASGGDMVRPGILGKDARPRNKAGVVFSILIPLLAAILLFVVIQAKLRGQQLPDFVIFIEALGFVVVILAGTWFLIRGVREHRESEERYRQMADHIQEIFWMLDAESKRVLEVNEAYESITGRTRKSLLDNPTSYEEIIHPDDRVNVLARLDEATRTGKFDERFRITLPNEDVRWVRVHGFPMRNAAGNIWRLVGTAQDITEQKLAEDGVVKNLEIAEAARAEADALRKATLALTQDLHMDSVMEALLRSLEELVPYTCARVIVPEGGPHLLALGEREIPERPKASPKYQPGHPLTLIADECPFLKRVLEERKSVLIPETSQEKDWQTFKGHTHLHSWLSVPLKASEEYLGFLSIGHTDPNRYTEEHLRRAELLSIPAAAAIQNARLYSTADMYASELQKRLVDLQEAETALAAVQEELPSFGDKFEKVFRASPIPLSITTLREGRFVDVNAAFERRYGYSRAEVVGRTVHELHMWCDPADRMSMTEQLRQGVAVRNRITWLRNKSGEVKLTAYSADRIHFDGQPCVLAVSEDLPELDQRKAN
jgi:PAS domain S-box-containing protein